MFVFNARVVRSLALVVSFDCVFLHLCIRRGSWKGKKVPRIDLNLGTLTEEKTRDGKRMRQREQGG